MTQDQDNRLDRLIKTPSKGGSDGLRYSRFIRRMRFILPVVALAITAVVFTWSSMYDTRIVPVNLEASQNQTVGKNELLNPRFESMDEKNQPYTITASRAIQGETYDDLVVLESPLGDIMLNDGTWVAIRAEQGAFRQDTQRLLLQDKVQIFHDAGYQLDTELLNIDLAQNQTWSDQDVYIQGPAGTLEAKGLKGDSGADTLNFTGPAKLVLFNAGEGGLFSE